MIETVFPLSPSFFSHSFGTLTCFRSGGGEDGEGQQNESSELSHLHPDDSDLADGSLTAGLGWHWIRLWGRRDGGWDRRKKRGPEFMVTSKTQNNTGFMSDLHLNSVQRSPDIEVRCSFNSFSRFWPQNSCKVSVLSDWRGLMSETGFNLKVQTDTLFFVLIMCRN